MQLFHFRPDISCVVSKLSKVIDAEFNSRQSKLVKGGDKLLLYSRENRVQIVFEHLALDPIHIVGFSDASIANNVDHSAQLRYHFLLDH